MVSWDTTLTSRPNAEQVLAGTPIGDIATSAVSFHSLALTADGKQILFWGSYALEQDSNPGPTDTPNPPLGTDDKFISIATGLAHSLAVASNGRVYGRGNGSHGQLGDVGGRTSTPTWVSNAPTNAKAVVAGEFYSMALTDDGKVFFWGNGSSTPTEVTGELAGKTVTRIAAGFGHRLAVTSDGAVYA